MRKMLFAGAVFCLCALTAFAGGQTEAKKAAAPKELKVWEDLWSNIAVTVPALHDTPLYKELAKRTGVKVTFIHPPQGQSKEQFNLMIASQDLPDLIYWNWTTNYPGGPEKAISDGVILKINDLIEKKAPNLTALYKNRPELQKASKTDKGTLYMFPFVNGLGNMTVCYGPQLRKDWLDQLKLPVPETLAEWETVLTAFKTGGKTKTPLTFTKLSDVRSINAPGNAFIQPFGTTWEFFQDDNGKIHFGPYESQFKDFLVFFKGWFDKGLVDPEMFSLIRKTFDAKILNGEVGAWTGYVGSGLGGYLDANAGKGTFDIVGAKYPVRNKGEEPFFGQRGLAVSGDGMAVTTKAKDPTLCATWADYGYGADGQLLFNFGIEGESFNWVTDYPGYEGQKFPKYTDLILKNPSGKTLSQMGGLYTRVFYSGCMVADERHMVQYAWRPAQQNAIKSWTVAAAERRMLPNISPTPQESEEMAAIMAEVSTYREEMTVKFLTGQEPIDNFPAFQARLKQMGIEKAIQIQQNCLERFKAR